MRKPTLDALLDATTFVVFAFLTSTGLLLKFFLPHGAAVWGLSHHMWAELHFWISLAFIGVVLVHLAQHARWIVSMVRGRVQQYAGRRAALALAGVVFVLALAVAPLVSPATPGADGEGRGEGHGERHGRTEQVSDHH